MKILPVILSAFALALSVIYSSCNNRPKDVLTDKEMVDLLTDLQIAQAYYSTSGAGSQRINRDSITESVLKKHNVSHEQLDSTVAYYGRNMDDYYLLFEKVEQNLREISGQSAESIKEDDIWPYSHFAAFFPGQMTNGITFSIPADQLERGSSVDWRMRVTRPDGIELTLGVEYMDGSASIVTRNVSGNRNLSLGVMTDTALNAKRIFGTMMVPEQSLPLWADSIRLVTLEYDSLEYSRYRSQKFIAAPMKKTPKQEARDTVKTDSLRRQ